MDFERIKALEPFWGNWYIKRKLGEGGYGAVFEIERTEFGNTFSAALKVMSIPQNDGDLKEALADGMTEEETTSYFEDIVKEMTQEFVLMESVKGHTNIVDYADHTIIKRQDSIGWDILIRMELLIPLNDFLRDNELTQKDICKLGMDMCRALEVCEQHNIIHRDIKPANIFMTSHGDYKLGDFGIARISEKTKGASTMVGTKNFVAPEVYKGEKYGNTVDLYSLGLVLYRLLNHGRLPFYPRYPEKITFADKESAFEKRITGELIPSPEDGNEELIKVLLKALAYKPEFRYQSAAEMRRDLENAYNKIGDSDQMVYRQKDILAQEQSALMRESSRNSGMQDQSAVSGMQDQNSVSAMQNSGMQSQNSGIQNQNSGMQSQNPVSVAQPVAPQTPVQSAPVSAASQNSAGFSQQNPATGAPQAGGPATGAGMPQPGPVNYAPQTGAGMPQPGPANYTPQASAGMAQPGPVNYKPQTGVPYNPQKKSNKTWLIPVCAVVVLGVIIAVAVGPVRKAIKYNNAVSYLSDGNYEMAYNKFLELGNYKDSNYSADYCLEMVNYEKANALFEAGDYEGAKELYANMYIVSDAEEMLQKTNFAIAQEAAEKGDYEGVKTLIAELPEGYEGVDDLLLLAKYKYAGACYSEKNYSKAVDLYHELGSYKDSEDQLKEARYMYAVQLIASNNPQKAIEQLNVILEDGAYKDSNTQLNEAKLKYAQAHSNHSDQATYRYLQELIEQNYGNAQAVYDSLYSWTATCIAINASESDTTTMSSSVSKQNTWYVHFKLDGGTPGETTIIKSTTKWPDGSTRTNTFDGKWKAGDLIWVNGWYTQPAYGKTGTVTVTIFVNGQDIGSGSFYLSE